MLRFETLHLSFPSSYRHVRTLCPIVQAMSGIVEVAETQVSECSTVRLQLIRHDLEWPYALVPKQLSHEFQCRPLVSALLNQDRGKRIYIITARRITSGDVLKYRNGFLIRRGYETRLTGSSEFCLTVPSHVLWAWRISRQY